MKILLDENIPKMLKTHFGKAHRVFTTREMKWDGKKNGELLGLMLLNDFEVFITADKNLNYQQNLKKFPIVVLVLDVKFVRPDTVLELLSSILQILKSKPPKGVTIIK